MPTIVSVSGTLYKVGSVFVEKSLQYINKNSDQSKRYLLISLFNVILHQSIFFVARNIWSVDSVATVFGDWSSWKGNVLAAVVTAIPSFLLSRYWVWEVEGKSSLRNEVIPFWVIAFVGLVVSSAFVAFADLIFSAWIFIQVASLFGYFVVWVLKFVLLNRLFEGVKSKTSSSGSLPLG